jgi:hypothetical protein
MPSDTPLVDIYNTFKLTKYGEKLAHEVRYEKYKPSSISNDEWIKILGPDVNNLEHMLVTYELSRTFIKTSLSNDFTEQESEVLLTSALIHDWAEAIVGDVSFGDRNADIDAKEVYVFHKHLSKFYTGKNPNHLKLIKDAAKDVIFNHESKLGKAFNAIERLGYLNTSIRAYHQLANDLSGELNDGLSWLIADVLCNQITSLIKYSDIYQAVETFLNENAGIISKQIALTDENNHIFQKYGDREQEKRGQFEDVKKAWAAWKND